MKSFNNRAQLSFEFMLYLLISTIALASVLFMYMNSKSAIQNENTKIFLQQFVSEINLHTNFYDSLFSVYIPYGACNAKFYQNKLIYGNSIFFFNSNIFMNWSLLCNESQSPINVTLNRVGNGFVLGVKG